MSRKPATVKQRKGKRRKFYKKGSPDRLSITVRMTECHAADISDLAERVGMSWSQYVESVMISHCEKLRLLIAKP